MLTYLQALKHETNKQVFFVDLDNSTRTSVRQLDFLKDKKRLAEVNLIDHIKRIEREKLFEIIENLNLLPFSDFYLDFGAPESQQLPILFSLDVTTEEFKAFEKGLDAKFVFNIVVAGGTSYLSCMEFTREVVSALNGKFEIFLYINEFSFPDQDELITEIELYAQSNVDFITGTKKFGKIAIDRSSGRIILDHIKRGKSMSDFKGFGTKLVIDRETAKV